MCCWLAVFCLLFFVVFWLCLNSSYGNKSNTPKETTIESMKRKHIQIALKSVLRIYHSFAHSFIHGHALRTPAITTATTKAIKHHWSAVRMNKWILVLKSKQKTITHCPDLSRTGRRKPNLQRQSTQFGAVIKFWIFLFVFDFIKSIFFIASKMNTQRVENVNSNRVEVLTFSTMMLWQPVKKYRELIFNGVAFLHVSVGPVTCTSYKYRV